MGSKLNGGANGLLHKNNNYLKYIKKEPDELSDPPLEPIRPLDVLMNDAITRKSSGTISDSYRCNYNAGDNYSISGATLPLFNNTKSPKKRKPRRVYSKPRKRNKKQKELSIENEISFAISEKLNSSQSFDSDDSSDTIILEDFDIPSNPSSMSSNPVLNSNVEPPALGKLINSYAVSSVTPKVKQECVDNKSLHFSSKPEVPAFLNIKKEPVDICNTDNEPPFLLPEIIAAESISRDKFHGTESLGSTINTSVDFSFKEASSLNIPKPKQTARKRTAPRNPPLKSKDLQNKHLNEPNLNTINPFNKTVNSFISNQPDRIVQNEPNLNAISSIIKTANAFISDQPDMSVQNGPSLNIINSISKTANFISDQPDMFVRNVSDYVLENSEKSKPKKKVTKKTLNKRSPKKKTPKKKAAQSSDKDFQKSDGILNTTNKFVNNPFPLLTSFLHKELAKSTKEKSVSKKRAVARNTNLSKKAKLTKTDIAEEKNVAEQDTTMQLDDPLGNASNFQPLSPKKGKLRSARYGNALLSRTEDAEVKNAAEYLEDPLMSLTPYNSSFTKKKNVKKSTPNAKLPKVIETGVTAVKEFTAGNIENSPVYVAPILNSSRAKKKKPKRSPRKKSKSKKKSSKMLVPSDLPLLEINTTDITTTPNEEIGNVSISSSEENINVVDNNTEQLTETVETVNFIPRKKSTKKRSPKKTSWTKSKKKQYARINLDFNEVNSDALIYSESDISKKLKEPENSIIASTLLDSSVDTVLNNAANNCLVGESTPLIVKKSKKKKGSKTIYTVSPKVPSIMNTIPGYQNSQLDLSKVTDLKNQKVIPLHGINRSDFDISRPSLIQQNNTVNFCDVSSKSILGVNIKKEQDVEKTCDYQKSTETSSNKGSNLKNNIMPTNVEYSNDIGNISIKTEVFSDDDCSVVDVGVLSPKSKNSKSKKDPILSRLEVDMNIETNEILLSTRSETKRLRLAAATSASGSNTGDKGPSAKDLSLNVKTVKSTKQASSSTSSRSAISVPPSCILNKSKSKQSTISSHILVSNVSPSQISEDQSDNELLKETNIEPTVTTTSSPILLSDSSSKAGEPIASTSPVVPVQVPEASLPTPVLTNSNQTVSSTSLCSSITTQISNESNFHNSNNTFDLSIPIKLESWSDEEDVPLSTLVSLKSKELSDSNVGETINNNSGKQSPALVPNLEDGLQNKSNSLSTLSNLHNQPSSLPSISSCESLCSGIPSLNMESICAARNSVSISPDVTQQSSNNGRDLSSHFSNIEISIKKETLWPEEIEVLNRGTEKTSNKSMNIVEDFSKSGYGIPTTENISDLNHNKRNMLLNDSTLQNKSVTELRETFVNNEPISFRDCLTKHSANQNIHSRLNETNASQPVFRTQDDSVNQSISYFANNQIINPHHNYSPITVSGINQLDSRNLTPSSNQGKESLISKFLLQNEMCMKSEDFESSFPPRFSTPFSQDMSSRAVDSASPWIGTENSSDSMQTHSSNISFSYQNYDFSSENLANYEKNIKMYFKYPFPGDILSGFYKHRDMLKGKNYLRANPLPLNLSHEEVACRMRNAAIDRVDKGKHENDTNDLKYYPLVDEEIGCYHRLLGVAPSKKLMSKCKFDAKQVMDKDMQNVSLKSLIPKPSFSSISTVPSIFIGDLNSSKCITQRENITEILNNTRKNFESLIPLDQRPTHSPIESVSKGVEHSFYNPYGNIPSSSEPSNSYRIPLPYITSWSETHSNFYHDKNVSEILNESLKFKSLQEFTPNILEAINANSVIRNNVSESNITSLENHEKYFPFVNANVETSNQNYISPINMAEVFNTNMSNKVLQSIAMSNFGMPSVENYVKLSTDNCNLISKPDNEVKTFDKDINEPVQSAETLKTSIINEVLQSLGKNFVKPDENKNSSVSVQDTAAISSIGSTQPAFSAESLKKEILDEVLKSLGMRNKIASDGKLSKPEHDETNLSSSVKYSSQDHLQPEQSSEVTKIDTVSEVQSGKNTTEIHLGETVDEPDLDKKCALSTADTNTRSSPNCFQSVPCSGLTDIEIMNKMIKSIGMSVSETPPSNKEPSTSTSLLVPQDSAKPESSLNREICKSTEADSTENCDKFKELQPVISLIKDSPSDSNNSLKDSSKTNECQLKQSISTNKDKLLEYLLSVKTIPPNVTQITSSTSNEIISDSNLNCSDTNRSNNVYDKADCFKETNNAVIENQKNFEIDSLASHVTTPSLETQISIENNSNLPINESHAASEHSNDIKSNSSNKTGILTNALNSIVSLDTIDLKRILNTARHTDLNYDVNVGGYNANNTVQHSRNSLNERQYDAHFQSDYTYDYNSPFLKIPIVRDYGHKPPVDMASDITQHSMVFANKLQNSISSKDNGEESSDSDQGIDSEFLPELNEPNLDADDPPTNDIADKNKNKLTSKPKNQQTSNSGKKEPSTSGEINKDLPQYKSRWEKIMERKEAEKKKNDENLLLSYFDLSRTRRTGADAKTKQLSAKKPIDSKHKSKLSEIVDSTLTKNKNSNKESVPTPETISSNTSSVKNSSTLTKNKNSNKESVPTSETISSNTSSVKNSKKQNVTSDSQVKVIPNLSKKDKVCGNKQSNSNTDKSLKEICSSPKMNKYIKPVNKSKVNNKVSPVKKSKFNSLPSSDDSSSSLFAPDKVIKNLDKKNPTHCMEKNDKDKNKIYGRVTNRGSFLTQSSNYEKPKAKIAVTKKRPRDAWTSSDEIHSKINTPNIELTPGTSPMPQHPYNYNYYDDSNYKNDMSSYINFSKKRNSISNNSDLSLSPDTGFLSPTVDFHHNPVPTLCPVTIIDNLTSSSPLPHIQSGQPILDPRIRTQPMELVKMSNTSVSPFVRNTSNVLPSPIDSVTSTPVFQSSLVSKSTFNFDSLINNSSAISSSPIPNVHHKPKPRQSKCVCLPPRDMKDAVGLSMFDTMNVLLLILEWNVDWLFQQRKNSSPPPISKNFKNVINTYETFENYYNTYFPLMLLETWQRIFVSWTHLHSAPPYICEIMSYSVEKSSIKVKCQTIFSPSDSDRGLFPEEGNILMVKFGTKGKGGIKTLGYVTEVTVRAVNPSLDSHNKCYQFLKCSPSDHLQLLQMTFIGAYTSEDFDTNLPIRVHVLCNVNINLKQNDALLKVKDSPLGKNILNPLEDELRVVEIASRDSSEDKITACVKEIVKGILSPHPIPIITIVKSYPTCDRLLILPPLIKRMKNSYGTKVLLCARTAKGLIDIGLNLDENNIKFVITGKRADIPLKLKKYLVEDLAVNRALSDQLAKSSGQDDPVCKENLSQMSLKNAKKSIFTECDVILSLIKNCHDDIIGEAFADGDIISQLCCIIDEASLCTEPEILIPVMFKISKLILIGNPDSFAKVCSKTASTYDFTKSLFHRAYDLDLMSE